MSRKLVDYQDSDDDDIPVPPLPSFIHQNSGMTMDDISIVFLHIVSIHLKM